MGLLVCSYWEICCSCSCCWPYHCLIKSKFVWKFFVCFLPELDCVLASLSDLTAHRNRSRLTVLLDVPQRKNKSKHNAFVICHTLKLNEHRAASSHLLPVLQQGAHVLQCHVTSSDWLRLAETAASSRHNTAMHQLTGRTCLETDGVRERVGTVWDELHICRLQGIGPQPVRDYTVERRSQWESEFNFNLSDPEIKESWAAGQKSQTDGQVRWESKWKQLGRTGEANTS